VDVVHHNVAQVPLAKDRGLFHTVNVDGTRNLLEAALAEGVGKVIYVSSSAVYGVPRRNPVTERTPPRPAEPYGRAKWEGELLCAEYAARGVDVSIVRPRTIMGHGRLGIFQILFEWIREGYDVPVLGRGDNVYQFVHADDLADACLAAAERPGSRDFNIGTDRFGTMRQVLEALCAHARTGSRVRPVPRFPAESGMRLTGWLRLSPLGPYHWMMYGRSMWFDTTRAHVELGWRPRWSNDEMFIQSYDWYLRNREGVLAAHGASHHRSAVREQALWIVKRLL
jgi:nucleoside-diphosphate-sugar epimerase